MDRRRNQVQSGQREKRNTLKCFISHSVGEPLSSYFLMLESCVVDMGIVYFAAHFVCFLKQSIRAGMVTVLNRKRQVFLLKHTASSLCEARTVLSWPRAAGMMTWCIKADDLRWRMWSLTCPYCVYPSSLLPALHLVLHLVESTFAERS